MADSGHSTFASWTLVLDELTDHVAQLRSCAADDAQLLELPAASWLAPVGIGDLPVELGPRAAALLQEMGALKPILEQRRDETARQLRAVETVPRDAGLTSVYLDSIG